MLRLLLLATLLVTVTAAVNVHFSVFKRNKIIVWVVYFGECLDRDSGSLKYSLSIFWVMMMIMMIEEWALQVVFRHRISWNEPRKQFLYPVLLKKILQAIFRHQRVEIRFESDFRLQISWNEPCKQFFLFKSLEMNPTNNFLTSILWDEPWKQVLVNKVLKWDLRAIFWIKCYLICPCKQFLV